MLTVIKIGGSVLPDVAAYARVGAFLAVRLAGNPAVVVVSAQEGATDALLRLACDLSPGPDPAAVDLLWSTGELRSVALLTLALHRVGVDAVGLGVHEAGLRAERRTGGTPHVRLGRGHLRRKVARRRAIVVPGFVALDRRDRVVSLGRGGSDLSAVILARDLGGVPCELVKDVPGYFTADPRHVADARPIATLTHADAIAMAAAGCDLVQPAALEAAARARLPLVVRGLDPAVAGTHVSTSPTGVLDALRD